MTECSRGDVVLVRYQHSSGEQPQLRPAVVVSSETYHQGRGHMVLAAVTGNPRPPEPGDTVVQEWRDAGLLGPSLVTGVLFTSKPDLLEKRLGSLNPQDMRGVESSLRLCIGL